MSYRIIIVALFIAMLALGATGCQRAVERAVEEATGIRVDEDGESVTITGSGDDGEEFTMEGSGGSLPSDWPSDVPVYPGAELESSTSMRIGDSLQMIVSWKTSDDVNDVYEWYRDELPAAGWEITGDFTIEQSGQRTASVTSSKGNSSADVYVGDDSDGGTGISIQVRTE